MLTNYTVDLDAIAASLLMLYRSSTRSNNDSQWNYIVSWQADSQSRVPCWQSGSVWLLKGSALFSELGQVFSSTRRSSLSAIGSLSSRLL
jgi:hypothetical protein